MGFYFCVVCGFVCLLVECVLVCLFVLGLLVMRLFVV